LNKYINLIGIVPESQQSRDNRH